jgi:oxygen-dependent protoporphyrinogen oxidase
VLGPHPVAARGHGRRVNCTYLCLSPITHTHKQSKIASSKTLILGGGLSGLAIAHRLPSCLVLEASPNKLGGWVKSSRRASGMLFEAGPHSLRLVGNSPNSIAVAELLHDLRLTPVQASSEAAKRLIWLNDKLEPVPSTLMESLRSARGRGLVYYLVKDILGMSRVSPPLHDETVLEFVARKFPSGIADPLVHAFIAGVYAGDASKLSSEAVLKSAVHQEKRIGSAFRPGRTRAKSFPGSIKPGTLSFPQGLGELVDALRSSLKPSCEVRMGEKVVSLDHHHVNNWTAQCDSGNTYVAHDRVVSTLGLSEVQKLLPKGFSPMLDLCVAEIEYVDVAVVNLHYNARPGVAAFGHLVASPLEQAKTGVLGMIYDSLTFPVQQVGIEQGSVLTVMLGGAHAPWVVSESSDEKILALAIEAVRVQLDIPASELRDSLVNKHVRCIPQFRPGHLQRAADAKQELFEQRIVLLGTGVLGVGIADAIGGSLREVNRFVY